MVRFRNVRAEFKLLLNIDLPQITFDHLLESIQDSRSERLAAEEITTDPNLPFEKLRLKENVLERNLSPSLQGK